MDAEDLARVAPHDTYYAAAFHGLESVCAEHCSLLGWVLNSSSSSTNCHRLCWQAGRTDHELSQHGWAPLFHEIVAVDSQWHSIRPTPSLHFNREPRSPAASTALTSTLEDLPLHTVVSWQMGSVDRRAPACTFQASSSSRMGQEAFQAAGLLAAALEHGAVQTETAAALRQLCGRAGLVVRYALPTTALFDAFCAVGSSAACAFTTALTHTSIHEDVDATGKHLGIQHLLCYCAFRCGSVCLASPVVQSLGRTARHACLLLSAACIRHINSRRPGIAGPGIQFYHS